VRRANSFSLLALWRRYELTVSIYWKKVRRDEPTVSLYGHYGEDMSEEFRSIGSEKKI
jgi:hypothetical protein